MKELYEWLDKIWPLFIDHKLAKGEIDLKIGKVCAYWAGTVLRIDIKPK
jgi:hypothetical protein